MSAATDAARRAAEGVRALNHATIVTAGAYEFPSDAADTLAELARAAMMLPQALAQLDRWLAAEHAASRVGVDDDQPLVGTVAAIREALGAAQRDADRLYAALARAADGASHLTGVEPAEAAS